MERPTFSQSWSRVSKLAPRLRPHVQIHRQIYRGEPWHIVHDPVGNNFFRLNPVAHHMVGLFDGKRNVDDVWKITLDRFGDAAPTQNEVIGLLAQLNQSNLLRVDLPADAEQLLKRNRERTFKFWRGQLMSILFIRIPIFNPERLLEFMLPLCKWFLNKWFMLLWVIWVGFCLMTFLPHVGDFLRDADSVLAPSNWGWMIVLFIATKALHEFGHGITCKRLGGAVPEVGIMMLVLFPAPFVDATSSWNFDSRWKRMLVAGAGMIFELALAGGAAVLWVNSEPGLVKSLAYNVVFLASVSTILFNANPLLRFDGYYMLSDVLEIPNLYERAQKQLKWMVQRFAYGMENARPPASMGGEQTTLVIYGVAAFIYKILVLFGIILFIAGQLASLGIALAIWSGISWGVVPLCKYIHWMATNAQLHEHRARAVGVTLAFIAIVGMIIGLIPMPEYNRTQGVVESSQRAEVAMGATGFVTKVFKKAGDTVVKGEVILQAENREMEVRRTRLLAQLANMNAALIEATVQDRTSRNIIREQMDALVKAIADIEQRLRELEVRSPMTGTIVAPSGALERLQDRFLQRGEFVARVVNLESVRVTAMVDQPQNSAAFKEGLVGVQLRTSGNIERVVDSQLLQAMPVGTSRLSHPALGYGGGGQTAMDPQDREQQNTLHPQFELWFELPEDVTRDAATRELAIYPGQRVFVRMELPKRPLLNQWVESLRKLVRSRLEKAESPI